MVQFLAPIAIVLLLLVTILCIVGAYQKSTDNILIPYEKLNGWITVLAISGGIFILMMGVFAVMP